MPKVVSKKGKKWSLTKFDAKQRLNIIDEALKAEVSVPAIADKYSIKASELYKLIAQYKADHPEEQRDYLQMRRKKGGRARVVKVAPGSEVQRTNGSSHVVVRSVVDNGASADLHNLAMQNTQLGSMLKRAMYERNALKVSLEIIIREGGVPDDLGQEGS